MTLDYQKVWNALNELEMVTSKVCSVREILDSAIDALEDHKKDKAEALMYAANEYLAYYLEDFDKKFKDAWNETVVKINKENNDYFWQSTSLGGDDQIVFDSNLNNSRGQFYYPEEYSNQYTEEELNAMCDHAEQQKSDKVIKWRLPVEMDSISGEYFIQFPDDLLERTGWEENDTLNWKDNSDGTFTLTKCTEPLEMDEC